MPKVSLVKDWHFWLIRFHLASFTGPRRLVKNDIDENSWGVETMAMLVPAGYFKINKLTENTGLLRICMWFLRGANDQLPEALLARKRGY